MSVTLRALNRARKALHAIRAARGALHGTFYLVVEERGEESALVVTLVADDPDGGEAVRRGRAVSRLLDAPRTFARGVVRLEGRRFVFERHVGRMRPRAMKSSLTETLARHLGIRKAREVLGVPMCRDVGKEQQEEDSDEPSELSDPIVDAEEQAELDRLFAAQGNHLSDVIACLARASRDDDPDDDTQGDERRRAFAKLTDETSTVLRRLRNGGGADVFPSDVEDAQHLFEDITAREVPIDQDLDALRALAQRCGALAELADLSDNLRRIRGLPRSQTLMSELNAIDEVMEDVLRSIRSDRCASVRGRLSELGDRISGLRLLLGCTNRLSEIEGLSQFPLVATEHARLEEALHDLRSGAHAMTYDRLCTRTNAFREQCERLRRIAERSEAVQTAKGAATIRLRRLARDADDRFAPSLDRLGADLEEADTLCRARDFLGAAALIRRVEAEVGRLDDKSARERPYDRLREEVWGEITSLRADAERSADGHTIERSLDALERRWSETESRAPGVDLEPLVAELYAIRRATRRLDLALDAIGEMGRAARDVMATFDVVPDRALRSAWDCYHTLRRHPHADAIEEELRDIVCALEIAEDEVSSGTRVHARTALRELTADLRRASVRAERWGGLEDELDCLKERFIYQYLESGLATPGDSARMKELLREARRGLDAGSPDAESLLRDCDEQLCMLLGGLERERELTWTLRYLGSTLDALHAASGITDASRAARACLDAAREALDEGATRRGLELAGEARELLAKARVEADLRADRPPDERDLCDLLEHSGGAEALDALVTELSDAHSPELFTAALKARFAVDVRLERQGPTDGAVAKRLYELLLLVPDMNVNQNPSLLSIEHQAGRGGGVYYSDQSRVVLNCGRPRDGHAEALASPSELPDVLPECRPRADVHPTTFDFTVLHEVGHAVDDRKHFMESREGDEAFGGWQTHGADVRPVAAAIARACAYDADWVESVLSATADSTSPPSPPPPRGVDPTEWRRAQDAAQAWCDAIRTDRKIWYRDAECRRRAVSGRVFQEAYPGQWVSYSYSARRSGITGYQFRAPGEWFSELYAAFHSDALIASHPAYRWLSEL